MSDETAPEATAPEGYDALTIPDLQEKLRERDLPVSGSKQELVDRLTEADAAAGPAPDATDVEAAAAAAGEPPAEEDAPEACNHDTSEMQLIGSVMAEGVYMQTTHRCHEHGVDVVTDFPPPSDED